MFKFQFFAWSVAHFYQFMFFNVNRDLLVFNKVDDILLQWRVGYYVRLDESIRKAVFVADVIPLKFLILLKDCLIVPKLHKIRRGTKKKAVAKIKMSRYKRENDFLVSDFAKAVEFSKYCSTHSFFNEQYISSNLCYDLNYHCNFTLLFYSGIFSFSVYQMIFNLDRRFIRSGLNYKKFTQISYFTSIQNFFFELYSNRVERLNTVITKFNFGPMIGCYCDKFLRAYFVLRDIFLNFCSISQLNTEIKHEIDHFICKFAVFSKIGFGWYFFLTGFWFDRCTFFSSRFFLSKTVKIAARRSVIFSVYSYKKYSDLTLKFFISFNKICVNSWGKLSIITRFVDNFFLLNNQNLTNSHGFFLFSFGIFYKFFNFVEKYVPVSLVEGAMKRNILKYVVVIFSMKTMIGHFNYFSRRLGSRYRRRKYLKKLHQKRVFKFFGNLNMFFSRFRVTAGFKVMPECFWTAVNWDADFYFSDFNMDGFLNFRQIYFLSCLYVVRMLNFDYNAFLLYYVFSLLNFQVETDKKNILYFFDIWWYFGLVAVTFKLLNSQQLFFNYFEARLLSYKFFRIYTTAERSHSMDFEQFVFKLLLLNINDNSRSSIGFFFFCDQFFFLQQQELDFSFLKDYFAYQEYEVAVIEKGFFESDGMSDAVFRGVKNHIKYPAVKYLMCKHFNWIPGDAVAGRNILSKIDISDEDEFSKVIWSEVWNLVFFTEFVFFEEPIQAVSLRLFPHLPQIRYYLFDKLCIDFYLQFSGEKWNADRINFTLKRTVWSGKVHVYKELFKFGLFLNNGILLGFIRQIDDKFLISYQWRLLIYKISVFFVYAKNLIFFNPFTDAYFWNLIWWVQKNSKNDSVSVDGFIKFFVFFNCELMQQFLIFYEQNSSRTIFSQWLMQEFFIVHDSDFFEFIIDNFGVVMTTTSMQPLLLTDGR